MLILLLPLLRLDAPLPPLLLARAKGGTVPALLGSGVSMGRGPMPTLLALLPAPPPPDAA